MINIFIDTCVLPRSELETAKIYSDIYGDELGFELLPMFDLVDFEENLKQNLSFFEGRPLTFHEPVWGVEHSAAKGSRDYDNGMFHLELTKKYADILKPAHMVYHLNNCRVEPEQKDIMLKNSLENLEEIREMFSGVKILVENTGTDFDGNKLLAQQEFTDLCKDKKFDVLIDVGHANANSWDIMKLVDDLKDNIHAFHLHNNNGVQDQHNRINDGTIDFDALMKHIRLKVPNASWIIEYTRPVYHGQPLIDDIKFVMSYV